MKVYFTAVIVSLILFLAPVSYAGSFTGDETGTTSAAFLKIGPGARAAAMGEAYTAAADDAYAVYWNPAAMKNVKEKQLAFMHAFWLESINYDYVSFVTPVNVLDGAFGGSFTYLWMDSIDRVTNSGDVTGSFSPYDMAFALSFAGLVYGVKTGASAKYIKESLGSKSAQAFALDTGVTGSLLEDKLSGGIYAGNIGTKLKFDRAECPLPFIIRAGLAYSARKDLGLSFDIHMPADSAMSYHLGGEYTYEYFEEILFIARAGYNIGPDSSGKSGISAGFGVNLNKYNIDYAYVPYRGLGGTHRLSLSMKFIKPRENYLLIP